jgi:hypothetical protein
MRRAALIFIAVVAAAGLAARPAAAHKFHASLAEVEYNAKERRVEIAVRLFVEDFEEALGKASGRRVRLDATPDVADLGAAYLRERLTITGPDGRALELKWVGMESKVDEAWVYLEAPSADGLAGATVSDRVFFELFDDQVNTVNLKDGARRTTVVFKPGDGPRSIAFP